MSGVYVVPEGLKSTLVRAFLSQIPRRKSKTPAMFMREKHRREEILLAVPATGPRWRIVPREEDVVDSHQHSRSEAWKHVEEKDDGVRVHERGMGTIHHDYVARTKT
jgi:hypothetical protein